MHDLRVPDGSAQGHSAPHGITQQIGFFEPEVLDQGSDIIRHGFEGHRAVDIGGVPMRLQLDGDDLAALRQCREQLIKHADDAQAAMQHN